MLNGPGTARERLLAYFRAWASRRADAEDGGCRQCCLAVKLSAEVSDLSEPMREVLASGMQRTELRISQAILAGQQDGSLSPAAAAQSWREALAARRLTGTRRG